jgi:hypothetical protein
MLFFDGILSIFMESQGIIGRIKTTNGLGFSKSSEIVGKALIVGREAVSEGLPVVATE